MIMGIQYVEFYDNLHCFNIFLDVNSLIKLCQKAGLSAYFYFNTYMMYAVCL